MQYAEVVFNNSIDHAFTYRVPEEFQGNVSPGMRVLAPFGKRFLTGIVVHTSKISQFDHPKDIIDVPDSAPLISTEMLKLCEWIAEYYVCTRGQALALALPKGVDESSKSIVQLCETEVNAESTLSERQRELYILIGGEPGKPVSWYQKKSGQGAFNYSLRVLREKKLVRVVQEMRAARVKELKRKVVRINPDANLEELPDDIALEIKSAAREPVLRADFLRNSGLTTYRLGKLIEKAYMLETVEEIQREVEFEYQEEKKEFELSKEQKQALKIINQSIAKNEFRVKTLFGVTGSGKTQIYLEAIKTVLAKGKTAIVLIPEISLTPQTVMRFRNFFDVKIAVFHSRMSLGERYDAWRQIRRGEIPIVVGPRSALFMPLDNLGIIVVDEEHESSYKQSDSQPRYNARDAAIYRAFLNKAVVILGSATPSMETFHNARQGKYDLITLAERVTNRPLPKVQIINARKSNKNRSALFSADLQSAISERLKVKEQVILLQNRRGHSSFLQCLDCGFINRCPNCEIALTYHQSHNQLVCHYCDYERPASRDCPNCSGEQIKYQGSGTQKVEGDLLKLFPQARILRMDYDTTTTRGAHEKLLNEFRKKNADILLGTQMIAKGLDFENVTLVGVISADIGLTLPDYRAAERVFQLLTQVAGRSGRGKVAGEVIIQANQVNHFAVLFAREHNYIGFYNEEIKFREQLGYSPYCRIVNILVSGPDLGKTIRLSREISMRLRKNASGQFDLIGPAPAPLPRLKNLYRWHILLKINKLADKSGRNSKKILRKYLSEYIHSRQKEYRVTLDVDPVDLM